MNKPFTGLIRNKNEIITKSRHEQGNISSDPTDNYSAKTYYEQVKAVHLKLR